MKNLTFLTILALALFSCSGPSFEISGTIDECPEGIVLLEQRIDGEWITLDSAAIADGFFTLDGQVEIPDVYYISIIGKGGKGMLFLENSDISFSSHVDSLYTATIKGSDVQDEYKEFNDELEKIVSGVRDLYGKYREALASGDEVLAAALEEEVDAAYEKIDEYQASYIAGNPASFIAPQILNNIHYGMEGVEIEEYLNKFDPALSASSVVKTLTKRVEVLKSVAVGKVAPNFTQNDVEGNPVSLSSLRGNYLLIDFWAAWCGPCRRENPNVVAAYNKYHDKGFDVLGVSLDQSRQDWLMAIAYDGLTWTQVSDVKGWGNEAAQLYGISSIPSNLLLDPEGKIIYKNLRGEDLHTELEKLLSK